MRRKAIVLLVVIFFLMYNYPVQAIGGGPTDHLENPSPEYGEEDVTITAKGVQLCIDVVVDQGCTVNVTFWWYNYTSGDFGTWEWLGTTDNITVSATICFWNINVSCATENAWSEWFHWMVVGNLTCNNVTTMEIMYSYFNPEDCPLFYIWPPVNSTNICPCCDVMCIGINNLEGTTMNVTFYRNDSMFETFYMINIYNDITNGTYCFCIDGHINGSIYYPMSFNESYYWYVNVTNITGAYESSDIFSFTTAQNISDCFCGNLTEALEEEGVIGYQTYIIGLLGLLGLLGYFYKKRRKQR